MDKKLEKLLIEYNSNKYLIGNIKDFIVKDFRNESVDVIGRLDDIRMFAEENELDELIAWSDYYLSFVYSDKDEPEFSEQYAKEALDYFEKIDDDLGIAYAYNALANCYNKLDFIELAYEMYTKGISMARYYENDDILEILVLNLIILCQNEEKYKTMEELLKYYDEIKSGKSEKVAILFDGIVHANMYNFQGKPDEAIKRLEKFVNSENDANITVIMSEVYKIYARSFALKDEIESARKYFKLSIEFSSGDKYNAEYFENVLAYGKCEFNKGDAKIGELLILDLYEFSKKKKSLRFIKRSTLELYKYYRKIENISEALKYLKIFNEYENVGLPDNAKALIARLNISFRDESFGLNQIIDDNLNSITEMGERICSSVDKEYILLEVKKEIKRLVNFDTIGLSINNKDDDNLEHYFALEENLIYHETCKLTNYTIANYCIKSKKSIFSNDFQKERRKYVDKETVVSGFEEFVLRTAVYMPLIFEDEVIAVFSLQSEKKNALNIRYISMLKLISNYLAIAIKNSIEYEKLQRIAIYDSLTGFLTKGEILLESEILLEKKKIEKKKTAICMLDMDGLKRINDTYGHIYGDELLRTVAEMMNRNVRKIDLLGRYGGDEFLLISPDVDSNVAYQIAERLRKKVENLDIEFSNGLVDHITISGGVYITSEDENFNIKTCIDKADAALYVAKSNNKNGIVMFNEIDDFEDKDI